MSLWARAIFESSWRPVEIFESKGGAPRNFGIKSSPKLPRWRSTCFRPYPAQLKTGPSGDGATSGVGETVNFSLASGQKLVDELCSAQDQARTY